MNPKNTIINSLGISLKRIFDKIDKKDFIKMYEIRLRANSPLMIIKQDGEFFLTSEGEWTLDETQAYVVEISDIQNTLEIISKYSMYALEEDIREGYLTIEGGHRVGVVGTIVKDDNKIKTIRYIGSVNIRIAHQIIGAANSIVPYLYNDIDIYNTLIVSPPRCGKTTVLRDIVRQLSNGTNLRSGLNIGVVDERSEIGGCYKGIPQNDVGIRTDILDGFDKTKGMLMLIRSMSPEVIVADEIGKEEDLLAIEKAIYSGVNVICTVHGNDIEDIVKKPVLNKMIKKNIFKRIVILSSRKGPGTIECIIDGQTLEDCRIRRMAYENH